MQNRETRQQAYRVQCTQNGVFGFSGKLAATAHDPQGVELSCPDLEHEAPAEMTVNLP